MCREECDCSSLYAWWAYGAAVKSEIQILEMKYLNYLLKFILKMLSSRRQLIVTTQHNSQRIIISTDHCFLQETTPVTHTGAESLKNKPCKDKPSSSYINSSFKCQSNTKGKKIYICEQQE